MRVLGLGIRLFKVSRTTKVRRLLSDKIIKRSAFRLIAFIDCRMFEISMLTTERQQNAESKQKRQ
jgi:hypothetical protein